MHILAEVCTRGRYDTTLPLTLNAILSQTRPPDALIIVDDNPPEARLPDFNRHPLINAILSRAKFPIMQHHGFGHGPHVNHEFVRTCGAGKELIWRVDDDEVPDPNVLGLLEGCFNKDKVGAVGGLVLSPGRSASNKHARSSISDVRWRHNEQWYPRAGTAFEVDHLHSTYLYRASAAEYPKNLSPAGHREETMHSHDIKRAGFRLLVEPAAVTYHYQQAQGGIRSVNADGLADEAAFDKWAQERNIQFRRVVPVVITQGLGDCFAALQAMPDILEFHKGADEVMLFVRPEVLVAFTKFATERVSVLPVGELQNYSFSVHPNVYTYWDGKGHLADCYRRKYCK